VSTPVARVDDLRWPTGEAGRRRRRIGILSSLLWFAFPVIDMVGSDPSAGDIAIAAVGVSLFVAIYLALLLPVVELQPREMFAAVATLAALAVLLTITVRSSWAMLFVLAAVVAGIRLQGRAGPIAIGICTALALVVTGPIDGRWDPAVGTAATTLAIGFLMMTFGRLIAANIALDAAREEVARLAVADERMRFARDLHDLLGHSLTLIAVKSELAGRLLPERADEAARHVEELHGVARDALGEVREAVSGYRRPTLAGELAGARLALEAAGIEARLERPEVELPPEVEALLAWTVREGTVNVIRHSGARHCRITIVPASDGATAEVEDDGSGTGRARSNGAALPTGHGLAGLRERAERLAGRLEAGAGPEGGFRLRVSVPIDAGRATA
jgi:two-component system, NarL family, sensor histidine kinase DesK